MKYGFSIFLTLFSIHIFAQTGELQGFQEKTRETTQNSSYYEEEQGDCREEPCCNEFFFLGEYLYWKPDQVGMAYCYSLDTPAQFGENNFIQEHSSDWGSGFRIGGGYASNSIDFDLVCHWTVFNQSSTVSVTGPVIIGTQILNPGGAFALGGSELDLGPAASRWSLKTDLVDALFGYRGRFADRFLLHPYFGVEWAWIDQVQNITYTNFFGSVDTLDVFVTQTNDFHGIGPKLGLDGRFFMGYGFGLFGDFSISFYYGKAKSPTNILLVGDDADFGRNVLNFTYTEKTKMLPKAQGKVGFEWLWNITDCFWFCSSVAYEAEFFWDIWRTQNSPTQNLFIQEAGYLNLSLKGLTADFRASVNF